MTIQISLGDITRCDADVVVNAANETLLGGGGVDGAIHDAAGPGLFDECQTLGGCPTGEVRVTGAHDLPFKAIIHAVGPIWQGGSRGEEDLLRACYEKALYAAAELDAESIAFPAISTGAFAFPEDSAAAIAVQTCLAFTRDHPMHILLMAFDSDSQTILSKALRTAKGTSP